MEALLIAPFDASAKPLRETVQKSLEDVGVGVKVPAFEMGADFSGVVTDAITSADLVIADISRKNANVFYELGYAHALRKNTILLVRKGASPDLPFDLQGMYYRIYDPQDPEDLSQLGDYLKRMVSGMRRQREALA